ncbi:MAG: hypothetical protein MUP28_02500 [Candidatus Aminicenantes bacterium]|nr:hypothetical protein [Candidatus Aminicenantes bacterium]
MAKCRFLYDNIWKTATLTALTSEVNFPVTNTQKRAPGRRWRSTSVVADQTIVANLGAVDIPATAFSIRGNNFTAAAVVTIQASHGNDVAHWAAPDFAAVLSPIDNAMMGTFFETQTYQYWRLVISDAANPILYVEAGPIFLGTHFEPAYSYKAGTTGTPEDLSVITKSAGGQRTAVIHDQAGVWQYAFRTDEKSAFETIRRAVGWSLPFWFCEDSDVPNAALYVVATAWEWEHLYLTTWTLTLTLAEEI